MLSGIQEILVIILILMAILFIPRMMSTQRRQTPKTFQPIRRIKNLSVRWRLAIVISLLWILGAVAYFRPWKGASEYFLLLGIGPVIFGWCITWVVAGLRPRRKN